MAEKRNESFKGAARRLFTADGELRKPAPEEQETPAVDSPPPAPATQTVPAQEQPPGPSAADQKQQAAAYRESSAEMDRQAELGGVPAKDMEITFERFLASLYMSGMLQLELMHEQVAPPQFDLIGARQTIDSLSLLSAKTKGNLPSAYQNFLQHALYELRMAYVEVTNAIAKGPQPVPAGKSQR